MCEVCGRAKHGAAWPYQGVGLSPAGGDASRHRPGAAQPEGRSGSSRARPRALLARPWRGCSTRAMTVRADSGFCRHDRGHRRPEARPTRSPDPTERQGQSSQRGHRPTLGRLAYTRGGELPKWLRPPSSPAAAATKLRGDDAKPASCASSRRTACSAPRASCGPTGATTASSDDLDAADAYHETTPQSSSPSETSKKAPGSCPSGQFFANGGRLLVLAPALGRTHPARQLTVAATIRTGSSPCRAASQPQPCRTCACAVGRHLHHRPATNPQPAPTHLSRPYSARRSAAEPHPPPTRTSPTPQSCTPQNCAEPVYTHAQRPPGPNCRSHKPVRWIQAKRAGGGGSLPPLTRCCVQLPTLGQGRRHLE